MWTILCSASAVFALLCFSSSALGALMPRTSSTTTCYMCPPYNTVLGGFPTSLWATMSMHPSSHDILCSYDSNSYKCTYDPTTGTSNSADTGCPSQLAKLPYQCPATVGGYPLTSATAQQYVTTCQYDDPILEVSTCKYNPDGSLYLDIFGNACPRAAPVCSVGQGAGGTRRRGVYKREDNFTAVMAKQRARGLGMSGGAHVQRARTGVGRTLFGSRNGGPRRAH